MNWHIRHNTKQLLIAVDQLLGVLVSMVFGEKAWADMSLSANAYRWDEEGVRTWPKLIIELLFFWEKEHCRASYIAELERAHTPTTVRGVSIRNRRGRNV